MTAVMNGKLVQPNRIIESGVLLFQDGVIIVAGESQDISIPENCELIDAGGNFIIPGFVDIHCHGGGGFRCEEDPVPMAEHHLRHGTTSLLCSIAYGVPFEKYLDAITGIRDTCRKEIPGNIEGIHMECPYISPRYGARSRNREVYEVKKEEYEAFITHAEGLIRQWTFSPELENLEEFADTAIQHGIALAMGHSEAGEQDVEKFYRKGARIVTHLFDATGCSVNRGDHGGTRDPWFDECCMVHEGMFVEVIPDEEGVHVRPLMLRLALKTMGEDSLCIITDASGETIGEDLRDVRINKQGELSGSKMTMDGACRNMMKHTGADMRVISRMASANPAKAVNIYSKVGSLEAGKLANFLITDELFSLQRIFHKGKEIL